MGFLVCNYLKKIQNGVSPSYILKMVGNFTMNRKHTHKSSLEISVIFEFLSKSYAHFRVKS